MNLNEFFGLLRTKKQTIASVVILFLAITAIFTFSQPLKYNSKSSVLVVQGFAPGTDQYAVSKSNEYIGNILAKVISSNLFYNDVISSGFNINKNYFSKINNINREMDKWRKTVQARAISDTGIIDIKIYHPDKQQLDQVAMAVNFILQSKHGQYHGLGSKVAIKIIDKPIISIWPTKPNIILNLLLAAIAGLIVSFYYIYLFHEKAFNLKLWPEFNVRRTKEKKVFNNQFVKPNIQLTDFRPPETNQATGLDRGLDFNTKQNNQEIDYPFRDDIRQPPDRENQDKEVESAATGEASRANSETKDFTPRGSINNLFLN